MEPEKHEIGEEAKTKIYKLILIHAVAILTDFHVCKLEHLSLRS